MFSSISVTAKVGIEALGMDKISTKRENVGRKGFKGVGKILLIRAYNAVFWGKYPVFAGKLRVME